MSPPFEYHSFLLSFLLGNSWLASHCEHHLFVFSEWKLPDEPREAQQSFGKMREECWQWGCFWRTWFGLGNNLSPINFIGRNWRAIWNTLNLIDINKFTDHCRNWLYTFPQLWSVRSAQYRLLCRCDRISISWPTYSEGITRCPLNHQPAKLHWGLAFCLSSIRLLSLLIFQWFLQAALRPFCWWKIYLFLWVKCHEFLFFSKFVSRVSC